MIPQPSACKTDVLANWNYHPKIYSLELALKVLTQI